MCSADAATSLADTFKCLFQMGYIGSAIILHKFFAFQVLVFHLLCNLI